VSDILDLIRVENSCDYRYLQEKDREYLVEVRGGTTYPLIEPISKITFCNIINLQNY